MIPYTFTNILHYLKSHFIHFAIIFNAEQINRRFFSFQKKTRRVNNANFAKVAGLRNFAMLSHLQFVKTNNNVWILENFGKSKTIFTLKIDKINLLQGTKK